jgi:DNA-binding NarL/FixJ family response regulator
LMSLRILLADDSPEVRQNVKSLLQQAGFEIVGEAVDGEEAVRLAQGLGPDVAILDISMPRLNGLGAAREIHEACPGTKAILLTAHTEAHQVLGAASSGIRGYVVKTDASEDLVRAVDEVSRGGIFFSSKASGVVIEFCWPSTSHATRSAGQASRDGDHAVRPGS